MKVGIVGYGSYIPRNRITVEEIAAARKQDAKKIKSGLLLSKKAVASHDEDTVTIAFEAAQSALSKARVNAKEIGAFYVGSESHPYAVKPTSTIVATALGMTKDFFTADLEFACKGGTAALQICYSMVKSDMVNYALAIGADTAQARPGDVLEYSAAAGGAAFILGNKNVIATIDETVSVTTDTPDFWRRSLQEFPEHTGRFTGKPSYFAHVIESTKKIMAINGNKVSDFDYVIFHQPNGKFPRVAAKMLGFSKEQVEPGLLVQDIGNTYSANSLLGLCSVLDVAKPNQKILLTSYGSGSGSDSFIITTTEHIEKKLK